MSATRGDAHVASVGPTTHTVAAQWVNYEVWSKASIIIVHKKAMMGVPKFEHMVSQELLHKHL